MKTFVCLRAFLLACTVLGFSTIAFTQSSNNTCATATPSINLCSSSSATTGDLFKASAASTDLAPAGGDGTAASSTFDVWFKFTATASTHVLTVSSLGNKLTAASTFIEAFNGACGTLTTANSLGWAVSTSPLRVNNLTVGTVYYVRVYSKIAVTANPSSGYGFNLCLNDAPTNDNCTGAVSLTSNYSCTNTVTTMDLATPSTGLPVGCESAGTHYDVWYSFVAASTKETIAISSLGGNITNPEIQLYSGACGALTSVACGTTSITATGLTNGSTYYVRVSNVGTNPSTTNNSAFSICVTHPVPPPANDNCANVTTIASNTGCTNTAGTLAGASASASAVPSSTCTSTTGADVWYKFVAQSYYVNIALSSIGSSLSTAGTSIQLLSGTCGNFTSLACVNGNTTSLSLNTSTLGIKLETGNTYYIRVYTPSTTPTTGTWGYNICVSEVSARIDFSRSYINVTKGTIGGTVDVGDILEMRATFVIRSKIVDSLSFTDTLFNTKGLKLVPGSIALRTNEGKIYGNTIGTTPSAFTDAFDGDAGWQSTSGLDTIIRINFGEGATSSKRGQLSNTSKPSVFTNTCIIMATYRVVVYAPYNTRVNFKTGSITYRDQAIDAAGTVKKVTFNKNEFIVYQSPGLCPNAVSASNALGAETNGTFGKPSDGAPLARNRGTTSYTTYTYAPFTPTGGPNDYYYAIANNTSARYTTVNTWPKPDPNDPDGNGPLSSYRLFQHWDITGDHTGASNTAQGNPACDTTQPVSATNPCGYMLVINSAYKADTAFTYTVNNLCPNTYYELSAWFKNICYKCGCDSLGAGSGATGYIPTAPGDSSGVRPNIAFDVNGADYYTTGDILYTGTTPTGSDATNKWVKRGFTYLTGPTQTSFTLTIRNNAPGGGGNDWAMDDISVTTCLPDMKYSPTVNPTICQNNVITVYDTVRSYFNNYNYYKWQRSTDGGTTWGDITGQSGSVTPVQVNSQWQYVTSYTVPPTSTTATNNGDKYRVSVATTSSNLLNSDCQFTDGISIINLTVLTNCTILPTNILVFNGKLVDAHTRLYWATSREEAHVRYGIEKSTDGVSFTRIGLLNSRNQNAERNDYSFTDTARLNGRAWYRIAMIDEQNRILYSRSIVMNREPEVFAVTTVVNPFNNDLLFDVALSQDTKLTAALYSTSGAVVKQQTYAAVSGTNGFTMSDLKMLPRGMYLLKIQYGTQIVTKKVMKQ